MMNNTRISPPRRTNQRPCEDDFTWWHALEPEYISTFQVGPVHIRRIDMSQNLKNHSELKEIECDELQMNDFGEVLLIRCSFTRLCSPL